MLDQFLIAPMTEGLRTDVEPWLIPEQAFSKLKNAYVWRGRLRKRFGSRFCTPTGAQATGFEQLTSRLRVPTSNEFAVAGGAGVGITDGVGDATGFVAAGSGYIGQKFRIADTIFTVITAGAVLADMHQNGAAAATAQFKTSTGEFNFVGATINTQIYYYDFITAATTDGVGAATGIVPGVVGQLKVGNSFSVYKAVPVGAETQDSLYTVVTAGLNQPMNITGAGTGTFSTTTGRYSIAGAAINATIYFYPAESVMGFLNYEAADINNEPTYAFDTQFSYYFVGGAWTRLGYSVWSGSDSQFFWGENYRGDADDDTLLFVTNNNPDDHVRYWDGTAWTIFTPNYTATVGDTIEGCRVIVSFKSRLLFLNTWESKAGAAAVNHPSRIRFSQGGSPGDGTGNEWYEGSATSGKGGFITAPTKEAIITARILRDRLIVFFERSTWEVVYTNNKVDPFIWQKIDGELGAESTFSTVLFDKVLLGVGNVGIHSCNGANVNRIDNKIPQAVFDFHNGNKGIDRVHGIRDYVTEMVYWTIPSSNTDPIYPTQVLVYNYRDKTWGLNDDSITCFGYLQNLGDLTWAQITWTWAEWTAKWSTSSLQSRHREVVAGNQQGYTFIIDPNLPRNAPVLQITNLAEAAGIVTVTCNDHNIEIGDRILIENVIPDTNGVDGIYEVLATPTVSTFTIAEANYGVVAYTGAGTVSRLSRIDILTKEYNFYQKQGQNVAISRVGFYVDKTESGEISVDFMPSSSERSLVRDGIDSGCIYGTSILETSPYATVSLESSQERFWHALYPQAEGETVQMRLYLDDAQMETKAIVLSDFRLNAFSIFAKPVKRF